MPKKVDCGSFQSSVGISTDPVPDNVHFPGKKQSKDNLRLRKSVIMNIMLNLEKQIRSLYKKFTLQAYGQRSNSFEAFFTSSLKSFERIF